MELGSTIKFYNNQITIEIWDEEDEKWIETPIEEIDTSFNRYMRCLVEFDENLTVKGFMEQLKPYSKLIDETFIGSSYGCKLEPYYQNMEEEPTDEDPVTKIEFYWSAETFQNNFSEYVSFHGYKDNQITEDNPIGVPYSLAISPIKDWQNAKMVLNSEYKVYAIDDIKVDENNQWIPVIDATKDYTLYDII
jgi:hypothetical protein